MEGRKGTDEQMAGRDVHPHSDRINPRRGGQSLTRAPRSSSEGERRSRGPGLERTPQGAQERTAMMSKSLEGHRATGKTEEDAGNTRDPLRQQRQRRHEIRKLLMQLRP